MLLSSSPSASPSEAESVMSETNTPAFGIRIARGVDAGAAVQHVGAAAALERVVAGVAVEAVGAAAALEEVVAAEADQRVVAVVAPDFVGIGCAIEPVDAVGSIDRHCGVPS